VRLEDDMFKLVMMRHVETRQVDGKSAGGRRTSRRHQGTSLLLLYTKKNAGAHEFLIANNWCYVVGINEYWRGSYVFTRPMRVLPRTTTESG
jgi:hypothetical protein